MWHNWRSSIIGFIFSALCGLALNLCLLTTSLASTSVDVHKTPASNKLVEQPEVQQFIQRMVDQHGFNKASLIALFNQVKIRPQIIQSIKKPLEQKATWHTYQMLFVDEWRIQRGVQFWDKYATILRRAEETYGVPPGIIVATIGVETRFGQRIGDYRVIDSLANLAFSHTPRAPYFQHELEAFLLLTQDEHLDPTKVMGSYAGAMGQPQFMPSSYLYYAVSYSPLTGFSNNGKSDLMHNEADVIGSVANYYHLNGWRQGAPVAVPINPLSSRYDDWMRSRTGMVLSLTDFAKYGITPKEAGLPPYLKAQLIALQNYYNTEYWLGFHNFNVIKRYNASDLYAMAVFQLSETITSLRKQ